MEEGRRRINIPIVKDEALECVMTHIEDPRDRAAISLVCKKWHEIDAKTRKHITIGCCYATTPGLLKDRFELVESLKVKGKPRAAMFENFIPEDWGGYAEPWINQIVHGFVCLKSLHFRRMIVTDNDLKLLAESRGHKLHTLKLDYCSGFSTKGLLYVARSCSCLKTLFLEDSLIAEPQDGEWLHVLASKNTTLENLNFYVINLCTSIQDLELIARNCLSLVSVKIRECGILELQHFFRAATILQEFGGGFLHSDQEPNDTTDVAFPPRVESFDVAFPPRVESLSLTNMRGEEMPMIFPFANRLKKLDLYKTLLDTEHYCELLQRCPNLEVLRAREMIGDRGLEVLAQHCHKLKRLRIQKGGEDEADEEGVVQVISQIGLSALAQGCVNLQYLAVYVADISNLCLETIATYCPNLCDFRLVLFNQTTELPLDTGVRALLRGCQNIRRLGLFLPRGGLTDVGLGFIGEYGNSVRWMILGYVGESDNGLLALSRGCPNLQKLELRGCRFSIAALSYILKKENMPSLKYLWMQGTAAAQSDLSLMVQDKWNVESIRPRQVVHRSLLAYCSLVGQRTDHPTTVVPVPQAPR